ncbi:MAG: C2H2-type zinc finger protein [Nitrososphaerales archaeon]|jgi:hypothetical protein
MDKQENAYRCDRCGATFRDADALVKHQRIHSGADEKKELEQGTQPPMEDSSLPPGGPLPIRPAAGIP